jgi:hypothetical protein
MVAVSFNTDNSYIAAAFSAITNSLVIAKLSPATGAIL